MDETQSLIEQTCDKIKLIEDKRAQVNAVIAQVTQKIEVYKGKGTQVKENAERLNRDKEELGRLEERAAKEIRDKQLQVEMLRSKIKKEEQRYQLITQTIMDTELQINEKERLLTKRAEEMDAANHRVMREQKNQREQKLQIQQRIKHL
jgi:chromosome segregation ATPase